MKACGKNGCFAHEGETCAIGEMTPLECVHAATKGAKGGSCNIMACRMPGAYYFNWAMDKYYCYGCARMLNDENGDVDGKGVLCPSADDREFVMKMEVRTR